MKNFVLPASVREFSLPEQFSMDASVIVPAVKGVWWLRYGKHAYYFLNLQKLKGLRFSLGHGSVIRCGLNEIKKTMAGPDGGSSWLRLFRKRWHYGFTCLEQIMMMTVPHTVTPVGNGRFIINLWAYRGYLVVDCREGTVECTILEDDEPDTVLGSQQWFDSKTGELYGLKYSFKDSLARITRPETPVEGTIFKRVPGSGEMKTVWRGAMADYMHDLIVNKSGRYCVACELGMYRDSVGTAVPSKALVVDLETGAHWSIDRFVVAAHAQFDPDDPDVVYFSNHNFQFVHSSIFQLLKKASYAIEFCGPASVFKYRLTPEGPREEGVFTRPDFYRLTNMHVFRHRGRKILAAMGFPDEIFIADAETMSFERKIKVSDPRTIKHLYSGKPALIGTISPSPDGEKLFVQTTRSFQMVDIETGCCDIAMAHYFHHTCSNHMLTTRDTEW